MSQELRILIERLDVKTQYIQASHTAELWLQFMKMMDILRMFLNEERMGIWELHTQAMYEMLPYLAVSGITCTRNAYMYTCSRFISFMKPIQRFPGTSIKGSTLYAYQIGSGQDFPLILSLSKSSCGLGIFQLRP